MAASKERVEREAWLDIAKKSLVDAENMLISAKRAENELREYHSKILCDRLKCIGIPISIVGDARVSVDKCIDYAQADDVLDQMTIFSIKCNICKATSICPRDPTACPSCSAVLSPRKAVLYAELKKLHYKC